MAKLRRSKSLEKVARSVKDSDDFVNHVFGIAAGYRKAGSAPHPIRASLKSFARHGAALEAWLRNAQKSAAAEAEALSALSTALHGSPSAARAQAIATQLWLADLGKATERALQALRHQSQPLAPRLAGEALRATFEHHGLKISTRSKPAPSDAVRLFCAIAKDSGDADMTPDRASQWLRPAPTRAAPSRRTN